MRRGSTRILYSTPPSDKFSHNFFFLKALNFRKDCLIRSLMAQIEAERGIKWLNNKVTLARAPEKAYIDYYQGINEWSPGALCVKCSPGQRALHWRQFSPSARSTCTNL